MKKIISSKSNLFLGVPILIFLFTMSILGFVYEVLGWAEQKGAGLICFVIMGSLFSFFIWLLNRLACVIWYEDGIIKRRGLIRGFYKECPVDSTRKVVIAYAWREGNFIYLVDDSTYQFDSLRKDSYIRLSKTKKNLAFVRTFWSGEIEKQNFV